MITPFRTCTRFLLALGLVLLTTGCANESSSTMAQDAGSSPGMDTEPAPQNEAEQVAEAPMPAEQVVSGVGNYVVRYEFNEHTLDDVPVNVPSKLVVVILDADGNPVSDEHALIVDAAMPHHRHGLVRYPGVTPVGDARFLVDGVLFHMPGRWELYFDVTRGGVTERSTVELNLE